MRLIVSLFVNTLALIVTAYLVPGFNLSIEQSVTTDHLFSALLAAIVLGLINTFIKPLLLLLTFPITMITLGLFIFIINAVTLFITSLIVKDLSIEGWLPAILAAVVLSLVSTFLSHLAKNK